MLNRGMTLLFLCSFGFSICMDNKKGSNKDIQKEVSGLEEEKNPNENNASSIRFLGNNNNNKNLFGDIREQAEKAIEQFKQNKGACLNCFVKKYSHNQ